MLPDPHPYSPDVHGFYCTSCGLPEANRAHVLNNTLALQAAKYREYQQSRADYFAVTLLVLRHMAEHQFPGAAYLLIDVTENQADGGGSYISTDMAQVLDKDQQAMTIPEDADPDVFEDLNELANDYWRLVPRPYASYKIDLAKGDVVNADF